MTAKCSPLLHIAAGLALASAATLTDQAIFTAIGKPLVRAARRVRKYDNLTGLWTGAYTEGWRPAPVAFNATLDDAGGTLSGQIDEPNTFGAPGDARLYSSLRGAREGLIVSFIKRYDGTGGIAHSVGYEGAVNAEFTRIDGEWALPNATGAFFMERAEGGAEAAASRAASAAV